MTDHLRTALSDREQIIQLIREEYDPRPNLGKADYSGFEWDDGAGRIADAILADQTILLRKQAAALAAPPAEVREIISTAINETLISSGLVAPDTKSAPLVKSSLPSGESDHVVTHGSGGAGTTPAQERREEIARIVGHLIDSGELAEYETQEDFGLTRSEYVDLIVKVNAALPPPKGEPSQEWNEAVDVPPFADSGYGSRLLEEATLYLNDYVFDCDNGADHEPTEFERFMLEDFLNGLVSHEPFFGIVRALADRQLQFSQKWTVLDDCFALLDAIDHTLSVHGHMDAGTPLHARIERTRALRREPGGR